MTFRFFLSNSIPLCILLSTVFSGVVFADRKPNDAVSPIPQRIVSLNLCADQLLMEMLPPEQLVGITHLSRDSGISYHHEKAKNYHQHTGRIEEIIALRPTLIIAGQFTTQTTNQLLGKLDYPVIKIGLPKTIADIQQQLLTLGKHVEQPERATTLSKQLSHDLRQLNENKITGSPKVAVYYANGFSAGKQTIVNEALTLAGLRNIAAEKDLDYIAPLSMETLIQSKPDALILGRYQENTDSLAHQVLKHRALQTFIQKNDIKTIAMPDKYWDCAGPSIVSAIAHLQQEFNQQASH